MRNNDLIQEQCDLINEFLAHSAPDDAKRHIGHVFPIFSLGEETLGQHIVILIAEDNNAGSDIIAHLKGSVGLDASSISWMDDFPAGRRKRGKRSAGSTDDDNATPLRDEDGETYWAVPSVIISPAQENFAAALAEMETLLAAHKQPEADMKWSNRQIAAPHRTSAASAQLTARGGR